MVKTRQFGGTITVPKTGRDQSVRKLDYVFRFLNVNCMDFRQKIVWFSECVGNPNTFVRNSHKNIDLHHLY